MTAKTKPWLSGHCNPSNPREIHDRCDDHPRADGVPCSCLHHMEPDAVTAVKAEHAELLPETWTAPVGRLWVIPQPAEYGELITPTGYLVTNEAPDTDAWFEARRGGITGTDLPKILGDSKYGNALSVWLDKRGELDDEVGEPAFWGHVLEDPVAQEWARRNSAVITTIGVVANVQDPWMRASLDRVIVNGSCPDGDGPCGLEVKTRSAFKSSLFRSDVPDDVLAQTTWGLMVTGLNHMHVAVLIGGQELRSFRVDRDPKVEEYLLAAAKPVWQSHLDGVPPEVHADADEVLLNLLNQLYASRAGVAELEADKVRPLLAEYVEGGALEKQGKAAKAKAKTGLVQLLDDCDTGLVDEAVVFTYKAPDPKDALSADALRRLQTEKPEIYEQLKADGFINQTTPNPQISIKEKTI